MFSTDPSFLRCVLIFTLFACCEARLSHVLENVYIFYVKSGIFRKRVLR
jgi:hypothetical protein